MIEKLNIIQRRAARHILSTPQSTANETATIDLGWESLQAHTDIRLIKFKNRIQKADASSLLGSCRELQRTRLLPFELRCNDIIESIGHFDFTQLLDKRERMKHLKYVT